MIIVYCLHRKIEILYLIKYYSLIILIDIEINRSNFSKAEELKNDLKKICLSLCEKIKSINIRLKEFEKKDAS